MDTANNKMYHIKFSLWQYGNINKEFCIITVLIKTSKL